MNDDLTQRLPVSAALDLLRHGALEIRGLLAGSSNYTFLVEVRDEQQEGLAVYKPIQGENPLWDFPHGSLSNRELAAYAVSEALGWHLVPPTVVRIGPYGKGAVQWFVDADFQQHYFTIRDDQTHRLALQRITAFDVAINNADRKSGHCLIDAHGRIWAIDHGVCFHVQPKLRTVIWEFAGEPIPDSLLAALHGLQVQLEATCDLYQTLEGLLSQPEIKALQRRVERLLAVGRFPAPDPDRRCYPWPLV